MKIKSPIHCATELLMSCAKYYENWLCIAKARLRH